MVNDGYNLSKIFKQFYTDVFYKVKNYTFQKH